MAAFGKFYQILKDPKKDKTRPAMNHAIVEDGHVIATNGHALCVVPLDSWAEDLMGDAEGKAFDFELLKELSKTTYERLEFTETTVQAFKKGSSEPDFEKFYSAILTEKQRRAFTKINAKGEVDKSETWNFMNWKDVIPSRFEDKPKIAFNPQLLKDLEGCFNSNSGLVIEFSEGPNKPVKIIPVSDKQIGFGILVPLTLKQ